MQNIFPNLSKQTLFALEKNAYKHHEGRQQDTDVRVVREYVYVVKSSANGRAEAIYPFGMSVYKHDITSLASFSAW